MYELQIGIMMVVEFSLYSIFFYIILRICSAVEDFICTKID